MTCVSGCNNTAALPDELFFWGEVVDEEVVVEVVAVVVLPADVGGVREERLRAALIRTFTVDGILTWLHYTQLLTCSHERYLVG